MSRERLVVRDLRRALAVDVKVGVAEVEAPPVRPRKLPDVPIGRLEVQLEPKSRRNVLDQLDRERLQGTPPRPRKLATEDTNPSLDAAACCG
jgi:hypothetical protein